MLPTGKNLKNDFAGKTHGYKETKAAESLVALRFVPVAKLLWVFARFSVICFTGFKELLGCARRAY